MKAVRETTKRLGADARFQAPRPSRAVFNKPVDIALNPPSPTVDAVHRFALFGSKGAVGTAFKQLSQPQYGLQGCFHFVAGVDYELALEPVDFQKLLRRVLLTHQFSGQPL